MLRNERNRSPLELRGGVIPLGNRVLQTIVIPPTVQNVSRQSNPRTPRETGEDNPIVQG